MNNLFVRLGITVIIIGGFCILMATGVLGHDLLAQIMCGFIGSVSIMMGILLIYLMKDDSLCTKQQNQTEVDTS